VDGAGSPKSSAPGPLLDSSSDADAAVRTPSPMAGVGTSAPALTTAEREARKPAEVMSRARVALALAGGAALIGAVAVFLATGSAPRSSPPATAARIAGSVAGAGALVDDAGLDGPRNVPDDASDEASAPGPALWRVGAMSEDASVSLISGAIGRQPMIVALTAAGASRGEAQRVARSLSVMRNVDRLGARDTFTLARDKASGRVVAYEIASSPAEVWQGREEAQADGSKALVVRKLDLRVEPVRVRKAVLVGADLRASLAEAGLGPVDDVLTMLDDALEGHAELSDIRPGARIRIVATQEQVDGAFVRWLSLDAVEYFPAVPNAPSVRVYAFGAEEGLKKNHGWYDAKGKQPVHGGWRMPVPLARVASRFNPHRMHPVLHVVMPHNGVDFAAPAGAPVYATAAGVVTSVGFDGPCGNKVEIEHGHGMTSVYCHLSRFAQGLRVGQHVEQRQLIAYVGQTGRVTGPHLHFGMRRGDVFIDPLTLRFDGVRTVSRARRDEFDRRRGELDAELDAIPLPVPPSASPEAPETETFYEEPP
jgi:murein DD-endopeptidase MepM/ murein hydrolase activator NlpD